MIRESINRYVRTQHPPFFSPKAVLFDMDGVLFDSMRYHAQSWKETAEHHQLQHTLEDFYMFEGRTGESTINELFLRTFQREATPEEKETIYAEKAALFNRYNDCRPMPGAADVIRQSKACGWQTLVVTGSGQRSLIDKLNQVFPGSFEQEMMVTAYDVKRGKPDPEPYRMGLAKAGVNAYEAIVVENAPMGVLSAVAAGIFTIAVNTGPLPDRVLLDAGAHLLYPDMEALAAGWTHLYKIIQETSHNKL